jgi:signal transduction histidine kinase
LLHRQLQDQNQILEIKVRERTHALAQSHEQLQALAANLTSMIEAERTQIARDVHDVLGQALTSLKMDVAWLEQRLPVESSDPSTPASTSLRAKTRTMSQHIDATIQSVQRIASQLRPALLDDFGLEAAIEWQIQEFQERTETRCDFVSSLDELELSDDQSIAAFRIFQEALTNIARHAHASRVHVLLEENAGHLMLEIQDNGRGISEINLSGVQSLGVLGMQERARLVGGEVKINGVPGQGTTVTVCIPLRPEQMSQPQNSQEPE